MSDVTIGRVKVKVHPDTKDFRRELKSDLEQIENRLRLTVDAVLNSKMLEKHADAVVARMNRTSERKKRQIEFDVKLDDSRVVEAARDARRRVGRAAEEAIEIRFADNRAGWEKALRELDRELAKYTDLTMSVDTDEESIRKAREKFQQLIDEYDETEVAFQAAVEAVAARAELARTARTRVATIVVNVSKASVVKAEATLAALAGLRMLHSTLNNIWDLFKNLDKNIPIIGSITEAIMGLSAWLLTALSNTFALSRSLAQIGALALLLPGLAAGFAVGIGSSVAVLKDFNKVIPELGRELSRIQDVMSDAFWAGAEQPIRNLIDTLLPQFESGLHTTSVLLGHWFGGLADSIRSSLDGALDQMFRNLALSIGIASQANDGLANSIKILGKYGSSYLPRLAGWYRDLINRFSEWLTVNDNNGRLTDWIELGIRNLKDFGNVLRHTGGILSGIARAAEQAGGSSLGMMADSLERVHKVVDSANFQKNLVEVLEAAHDAMHRISTQSGPSVKAFFNDFSTVLAQGFRLAGDAIGDLLDGIFRGLSTDGFSRGFLDFLDGLRRGIASLDGAWEPIGEAVGAIGTLAGALAREFGPLLATVLTSLSKMVVQILPKIIPTIDSLTTSLARVLDVILPLIEGIVGGFATMTKGILSTPAGIVAVVAALVSLRGALALGSVALRNMGALSTFFGTHPKASAMAGSLGRIGLKLGALGLGVAALGTLAGMVSTLDVAAASTQDFETALGDLANSGSIEKVQSLFAAEQFSALNNVLNTQFENTANSVSGLADAFGLMEQHAGTNLWDRIWGNGRASLGLGVHSAAFNQAKDSIASFDESMSNLVASGDMDALAAAQGYLNTEAGKLGISVGTLVDRYLPQYSSALDTNRVAAETAGRAAADAALLQKDALLDYEVAIQRVGAMSPGLMDAINNTSKEFINLSDAIGDEALPSVDAWLGKLEEQATAMVNWADNLVAIKERGVSDAVIAELERMGVEGAPMVAQLVNASDAEFARLEEVIRLKTEGAVGAASSNFALMNERVKAELARLSPEAKAALEEMGIEFDTGAKDAGQKAADGLASKAGEVEAAVTTLNDRATAQADRLKEYMRAKGAAGADGLGTGLSRGMPGVGTAASGLNTEAVKQADKLSEFMRGKGAAGADGFGTGMTQRKSQVTRSWADINNAVNSEASRLKGTLDARGVEAGGAFASGIGRNGSNANTAGRNLATNALNGASGVSLYSSGSWAGQGFVNGVLSKVNDAYGAGYTLAGATAKATASRLAIQSPSRVFMTYGEFVGDGFIIGVESRERAIAKAVKHAFGTNVENALDRAQVDPFANVAKEIDNGRRVMKGALATNDASAAGANARPLEVNFNGPVGNDPLEIAASIERRTMDALAMEGLVS